MKATPKAVYNRSYVRGFARPPLPGVTDAAPAVDTAFPTPPSFLLAEDDPTSNHYQAPIFRQPLSLAQLIDICSDPMILSSLPTPGIHVTRLTAQGKPREYIMYRCSVCGKEVGDKSKHKKHEASCKKRILKMLNLAEREEEQQKNMPVGDEAEHVESRVKEERKRKVLAVPAATSDRLESAASSRPASELSVTKPQQQAIEKSEMYQVELKKQLKSIWHTMDVSPATCLLSRDSVLARIDLTQMFTGGAHGNDLFGLLSDEEQASLLQYLPRVDQAAAAAMRGEHRGAVKQEFPTPRKESVLSALRSTLATPVFVRSLDEYKRMLMSGSLDPALKGLRMMATARRRRQQRETEPSKPTESAAYWGEQLSEIAVKAAKPAVGKNGRALLGGWRGLLLGKKHKAVPAGPTNGASGQTGDGTNGISDGAVEEEQEDDTLDDDGEQSDRTDSDTATDQHAREGTEDDRNPALEDNEEEEEEEELHAEEEGHGRRPLHGARRRQLSSLTNKRSRHHSSSRPSRTQRLSTSEKSSDSSSYSPLHIDSLLPLPLQLKLPPVSMPDIVPAVQRFHMRSPRFRRVRYARFVLKDGCGSLIDARDASTSSSPVRSSSRKHRNPPSLSLPFGSFSHLPRSIARQCMQLQRRMMSAEEKQAAQQRIKTARSVRLRQTEQSRLNAANEAETQLLQLMEATASEATGSSGTRREDRRRHREDAERQQRITHGMKRPRAFHDNGEVDQSRDSSAGAENDDGEEDEADEQPPEQAEDDEAEAVGDIAGLANGRAMHIDKLHRGVDDVEQPLSRIVGEEDAERASATAQSEAELDEGADEKRSQSRPAGAVETHLYTPVFPRSKFGFSSFVKQAVGQRA